MKGWDRAWDILSEVGKFTLGMSAPFFVPGRSLPGPGWPVEHLPTREIPQQELPHVFDLRNLRPAGR